MVGNVVPGWVRVTREFAATIREVSGVMLLVASLVTASALWATQSVRSDVKRIDERTYRTSLALELLVTMATTEDSSDVRSAMRQLRLLRRVFPESDYKEHMHPNADDWRR